MILNNCRDGLASSSDHKLIEQRYNFYQSTNIIGDS
jgi:hypothetical protein